MKKYITTVLSVFVCLNTNFSFANKSNCKKSHKKVYYSTCCITGAIIPFLFWSLYLGIPNKLHKDRQCQLDFKPRIDVDTEKMCADKGLFYLGARGGYLTKENNKKNDKCNLEFDLICCNASKNCDDESSIHSTTIPCEKDCAIFCNEDEDITPVQFSCLPRYHSPQPCYISYAGTYIPRLEKDAINQNALRRQQDHSAPKKSSQKSRKSWKQPHR